MSRDMFFIPLIDRATRQPDVASALRLAFLGIRRLGQHEGYRRGWLQFRRFMDMVAAHAETEGFPSQNARSRFEPLVELTTRVLEGSPDERRSLFPKASSWLTPSDEIIDELKIEVSIDDHHVGTIPVPRGVSSGMLSGIGPGRYSLSLTTGCVLWEGNLAPPELLWRLAFPGRPLEMAAATGDIFLEATRTETLLEGELVFHVLPGIESGRLVVVKVGAGAE